MKTSGSEESNKSPILDTDSMLRKTQSTVHASQVEVSDERAKNSTLDVTGHNSLEEILNTLKNQ